MVIATTSNTGDKVHLYDHETYASSTYGIYLNPVQIRWQVETPLIGKGATTEDISFGSHVGETRMMIHFIGCTFPKDGTGGDWEIFVRYISYWADNDNDKMLHLIINDVNDYNIAKWADPDNYGLVAQIKGKLIGMPNIDVSDTAVWRFNLTFQRLTYET